MGPQGSGTAYAAPSRDVKHWASLNALTASTTVSQFSDKDSANTHWVISEIFRAMNTGLTARPTADLRNWANAFPYVNGGLFSGDSDVPRFSKIARSYLLHIGSLDWTRINPDIFGSMIQAVARQPELKGELQGIQWIGFALTEAVVFYGLLGGLLAYVLV